MPAELLLHRYGDYLSMAIADIRSDVRLLSWRLVIFKASMTNAARYSVHAVTVNDVRVKHRLSCNNNPYVACHGTPIAACLVFVRLTTRHLLASTLPRAATLIGDFFDRHARAERGEIAR